MSEKISKTTSEELNSPSKENGAEPTIKQPEEVNGKEADKPLRRSKRAGSRSSTPQIKNGVDKPSKSPKLTTTTEESKNESNQSTDTANTETSSQSDAEIKEILSNASPESVPSEEYILTSESYMEPLILSPDEPSSELEFEDCSDKDSGKNSPILSRCETRRSQNKNIPTPKTPKLLMMDDEMEKTITSPNESSINYSIKAQFGDSTPQLENSDGGSEFLLSLRKKGSKSVGLSSRKSISLQRDDIRRKSLRISMLQSNNLSIPFFSKDSMEQRAPSVKRSRSESPDGRKKFKIDSTNFITRITSPLSGLKNKLMGSPNGTSTPKLTSYHDQRNHLGGDFYDQMPIQEAEPVNNKWCSIM